MILLLPIAVAIIFWIFPDIIKKITGLISQDVNPLFIFLIISLFIYIISKL